MADDLEVTQDDEPKTSGMKKLREDFETKSAELKTTATERDELARELALYKAGLGELGDKKVKALLAAHEGELNPSDLKATAIALGFAEDDSEEEEQQQAATEAAKGQARLAAAQNGAGGSQHNSVITAADVAAWPIDKQARFMKDHPNHWELLKRGEDVTGVAFV